MARDCRELLDALSAAATASIDNKLNQEYSGKELSDEQIKDIKWSAAVAAAEAYLASIAHSLAYIADHMDEKGEK